MVQVIDQRDEVDVQRVQTLGSVRLQKQGTNQIILIPTPSDDPNDPLNCSKAYRSYMALLVCLAMVMCNFLAAGPSVAIVDITIDYFHTPPTVPAYAPAIAKISYFFTTTSLLQGIGNLIWMPLIVKYGRRPIYLSSFTLYTACAIWCGCAKSYGAELAGRIVMGFAAGSGECVAPLTIADIFFLHERGLVMACYTAALSCGVSLGIIISGLITINHDWRYIYYVATALIGALTVLVFLTMPETSYNRSPVGAPTTPHESSLHSAEEKDATGSQHVNIEAVPPSSATQYKKRTYLQNLKLFSEVLTSESLFKIFLRPIALLILPPVLWATLCMAVTIGFLVAISSNFASAFSTTYNFTAWQSGLCFIAGVIGALIGIFFGGWFSDWTANVLTARNNGIREPEMRLPSMTLGLIASPLALILYGVGIQNRLHWMVPTLGLGLLNFAITQATNVSLVYTVDAYRPVAGEVVTTQLAFKAAFGFLLSFYTNPWIQKSGYLDAFGAMAGISAAVLLGWIFFFVFGKRIRHASVKWRIMKSAQWDLDREVGE
ncbi:uncharacterized protein Z518_10879 [Rhinocladiella mackenziei CBS 650.93]|uniref:Rhinocladiella mackenziei CBS 650.93 unplaced genomic scaffold supercont1.10, whole genome shotgun sequence n=1 Tax=Rhinocladiella mackenziei CBS 650.93 TaxID=1442369 RepID=A0A0D2FCY9_9EURO|nr:uncharacterized protein Z518_10879 [Rhinocladiella mackenziei CBS 650.93]KIW99951.1 hypothetical protein Z518_10879 [Rhinocladiella mackenziei CBS 650.93]